MADRYPHPHPLADVPDTVLEVARKVLEGAAALNDVDYHMASPIAEGVVAALLASGLVELAPPSRREPLDPASQVLADSLEGAGVDLDTVRLPGGPIWEMRSALLPSSSLNQHLADGWEPFAVSTPGPTWVHLRRCWTEKAS